MTKLYIPGEGERIGPTYQRIVTVGNSTGDSPDVNTQSASAVFPIVEITEANVMVHNVEVQIVDTFIDSGVYTIGDTTDPDGFWTDTLFNTASSAVFANMATTVAYAQGRLYTAAQSIDVTRSGNIGTNTEGLAKIRVTYSRGVDTDLAPSTGT